MSANWGRNIELSIFGESHGKALGINIGNLPSGIKIDMDAVKREMKEETGLDIYEPKLAGIKQFPIDNGRYIVLLFKANNFSGELISSAEGNMEWIDIGLLDERNVVDDLHDLIRVIEDDNLTEFQYILDGDNWLVSIK